MKDLIIMAVESTAAWRQKKAREYRDDRRNIDASLQLADLARELSAIPEDDPRLIEIEAYNDRPEMLDLMSEIMEQQSVLLRLVGFSGGFEDAGAYLDRLVEIHREAFGEHGRARRTIGDGDA